MTPPIDQRESWHVDEPVPPRMKYQLWLAAIASVLIVGGGIAVLWFGWAR